MKLIKYITGLAFLTSLILIISGYSTNNTKFIGFGVVCLFFIVIPLFSYYRWKDRDIKDYVISKENLEKMRENERQ